ncbi:MAG: hypothetical protein KDK44_01090 [Chlamydiia bacterium]|nr:hypothetical protein [Chlamydiia bacterium]
MIQMPRVSNCTLVSDMKLPITQKILRIIRHRPWAALVLTVGFYGLFCFSTAMVILLLYRGRLPKLLNFQRMRRDDASAAKFAAETDAPPPYSMHIYHEKVDIPARTT